MPNWCHNTVVFTGTPADCRAFRELLGADRGAFDLDAVTPMPPELLRCNVSDETAYQLKYGEWENEPWYGATNYPNREAALQSARHPENAERWGFSDLMPAEPGRGDIAPRHVLEPRTFDEAADMAYANVLKHGHVYWRGWTSEHWGTKWNIHADVEWTSAGDSETARFETAWVPPLPVLERLATRFPLAEIAVDYFEPMGGFQGRVSFAAGALAEYSHGDLPPPETRGNATT
jgi:hypothetical protein